MEGLYPITEENKRVAFDANIYDRLSNISNLANKWFEETFVNPVNFPQDLLITNLTNNIEFYKTTTRNN